MKNQRSVFWLPIVIGFLFVFGCDESQPVDPGEPLLGEIISFNKAASSEFEVATGARQIDNGILDVNPVGNFRGYTAKSLFQFTSFSVLDGIATTDIVDAWFVFPFHRTLQVQDTENYFTIHAYTEQWTETSSLDSVDFLAFTAVPMDSVVYPTELDSLQSASALRFSVDTALVREWVEMDRDNENNPGLLLQGVENNTLLYGNTRTDNIIPILEVSTGDTTYTVSSVMDYGLITGNPDVNASPEQVVLRKASNKRVSLRWSSLLDTLVNKNIFIHSAEMSIPIDTVNSYNAGRAHRLVIGEGSDTPGDEFLTIRADTLTVAENSTSLTVNSGESESLLRNYIQRYLNSESPPASGVILLYQQAGAGIQHLVLNPGEAELRIVYSEVEE